MNQNIYILNFTRIIKILSLLALFFVASNVNGQSCRQRDSLALVDFWQKAGGPNWTNKWDLTKPINNWYGISLNIEGCVECIDLSGKGDCLMSLEGNGNNLIGQLSPKMQELNSLKILKLNNNKISGILFNLASVKSLTFLNIRNNLFSGIIPNLDECAELKQFWGCNNNFSGNLPSLSKNIKLTSFASCSNRHTGSMPNLNSLIDLTYFDCSSNSITGSISNLSNNINLQTFGCAYNRLTGQIPRLSSNLKLVIFKSDNNLLSGPIPDLSNNTNLEYVYFQNNQLSGTFPNLSNNQKILELWCRNNRITGNLPKLINNVNLRIFIASENSFVGEIPDFSSNKNLFALELHSNKFTGNIPDFSKNLLLEFLSISNNELKGNLNSLNANINLKHLYIEGNKFIGVFPDFSFNLKLEALHCNNNFFDSIPTLMLPNIKKDSLSPDFGLRIFSNRLTFDDILPNIGYATTATFIYSPQDSIYRDTTFTRKEGESLTIDLGIDAAITTNVYKWYKNGVLVDSIVGSNKRVFTILKSADAGLWTCRVTNPGAPLLTLQSRRITVAVQPLVQSCRQRDSLALVDFWENAGGPNWRNKWDLTKPMNTWYGIRLIAEGCVECIDLDGNVGCSPDGLGIGNNLSGTISGKLDSLKNLKSIHFSSNKLGGQIPNLNLPKLETLAISWNQLSDSIPNFFLPSLISLQLDNNKLTGKIPNFDLPNLRSLVLYKNTLIGTIPNLNMPNLVSLHLYSNDLYGKIPNFNLPNLRSLVLHQNKLSGEIPNFNMPELNELSLDNNLLSGKLPAFEKNVKLSKLWFQNNRIDGIPKLILPIKPFFVPGTNIQQVNSGLNAQKNSITFKDILPNINYATSGSFIYSPQDSIYRDTTFTRKEGESPTIDLGIDAAITTNIYKWFKNGVLVDSIVGSNKRVFTSLKPSDAGAWTCRVTNPEAPLLTLQSRRIMVNVMPQLKLEIPTLQAIDSNSFTLNYFKGLNSNVSQNQIIVYGSQSGYYFGQLVYNDPILKFISPKKFKVGETLNIIGVEKGNVGTTDTLPSFNIRTLVKGNLLSVVNFDKINTKIKLPSISYNPQSSYNLLSVDLNGDSKLDFIYRYHENYGANTKILVYLKNQVGTFDTSKTLVIPYSHTGLVGTFDFNRDGFPDLLLNDNLPSQMIVLLNDKQGNFLSTQYYSVSSFSNSATVSDIDNDGYLDIVSWAGNSSLPGNNLSILKNRGNGTFLPQININTGIFSSSGIFVDLDKNGYEDFFYTSNNAFNSQQNARVFYNNKGILNQKLSESNLSNKAFVYNGIYAKDSSYNFLVVNSSQKRFELYNLKDNNLSLNTQTPIIIDTNTTFGYSADLNGDGILDLIGGNDHTQGFSRYYINDGKGNFSKTSFDTTYSNIGLIELFDFENDGDVDLAYLNRKSGEIMILAQEKSNQTNFCSTNTYNHKLISYFPFDNDGENLVASNEPATILGQDDAFGKKPNFEKAILNNGLSFNNINHTGFFDKNNYAILPELKTNLEDGFSISLWTKFRSNATATVPLLASHESGVYSLTDCNSYYALSCNKDGEVYFVATSETYQPKRVNIKNRWAHLTLTYQKGEFKFYVDGLLIQQVKLQKPLDSTVKKQYLGYHCWQRFSGASRYNGVIDEVRIFSRELNQDDINYYRGNYNRINCDEVRFSGAQLSTTDNWFFNQSTISDKKSYNILVKDLMSGFYKYITTHDNCIDTIGFFIDSSYIRDINKPLIPFYIDTVTCDISQVGVDTIILPKAGQFGCDSIIITRTSLINDISNKGLILHYPFDGIVKDVSNNNLSPDYVGTSMTTDRFGRNNGACYFAGSITNYIKIPHNNLLNLDNAHSISLWVKSENLSLPTNHIISKGRDLNRGAYNIQKWSYNRNPNGMGNGSTITDNIWYHLAFTTDPVVDSAYMYVNGKLVAQSYLPDFISNNTAPLILGRHFTCPDGSCGFEYQYKGKMDDIRIYNRKLSLEEIKILANSDFTYLYVQSCDIDQVGIDTTILAGANQYSCDSIIISQTSLLSPISNKELVAYYPLDGNANDLSGFKNNGLLNGPVPTTDRFSITNSAYNFDGVNDIISTTLKPKNNSTISIWFNPEKNQLFNAGLFSTFTGVTFNGYYVSFQNSQPILSIFHDGNKADTISFDSYDKWHHLVISSFNNNEIFVYLDGQFKKKIAGTTSHASNIVFGDSRYNGRYFKGKMDDIQIFDRDLTLSEIQNLFSQKNKLCYVNPCLQRDSLALVDFWQKAGGPNWTNKWDLSKAMNTWYGIRLSAEGCVECIDLDGNPDCQINGNSGNNLDGSISPKIDSIKNLKSLYLSSNKLNGSITNFNLPNLTHLMLFNNRLSGKIPNFNLPKLTFLHLGSNLLEDTIPNFDLPNLKTCYLFGNNLKGKIPNFNLPSLEDLRLSNNQLDGAIPDLSKNTKIGIFWANNNRIDSIGRLSFPNLKRDSLGFQLGLRVNTNRVTFDDILPNIQYATTATFIYAPQDSIYRDTTFTRKEGEGLTIELGIDAAITTNVYKWYKNGVLEDSIVGSNKRVFTSLKPSDAEVWTCRVTNPGAPLLTLQSRRITVNVQASCRLRDSLALVDFWEKAGGPNWTNKWDLTKSMNTWYGIKLSAEGCVECIDMDGGADCIGEFGIRGNNMSGTISPKLDSIKGLKLLILNNNNLSGSIPPLNLTQLSTFFAARNKLSGNLPILNLPNLMWINFFNNELTGRIDNLRLPNVIGINLSNNKFSDQIPNINFVNLQFLDLDNNLLKGPIPNFNLPKLQRLWLFNNQLDGPIPNFNLPELIDLSINSNQIRGVVPNFTLPKLEGLRLNDNKIDSISRLNLPNLKRDSISQRGFRVFSNRVTFDDILPNIQYTTSATFLYSPQDSIYRDTTFTRKEGENLIIDLGIDAAITTNVYKWYKNGVLVDSIRGSNKRIFAPIKSSDAGVWTCRVTNPGAPLLTLQSRRISVNVELTCQSKDSITLVSFYNATGGNFWTNKWNFIQPYRSWQGISVDNRGCVTGINLTNNNLTGSLPTILDSLLSLNTLILSSNKLDGNIPRYRLPNLSTLFLNFNQFIGSVPNFEMQKLNILSLDNNKLSNSIPNFNLPNLQQLQLNNNQLSDVIPNFNLPNLQVLGLFNNKLSGTIPNFTLPNLKQLLLFDNLLSGTIPNFNLPNLENINIKNNKIDSIPRLSFPNLKKDVIEFLGLRIFSNRVTFDDILPNIQYVTTATFLYSPQDSIYRDTTFNRKEGESLMIDLGIDVAITTNVYKWYKNGVLVDSIRGNNKRIFSVLKPSDTGVWTCRVTNPGAPLLTLFSRRVTVNVVPIVPCGLHPDYKTLDSIYIYTGADKWKNITGWNKRTNIDFCNPCNGWYGVECRNNRVVKISLSGNNLDGLLPDVLGLDSLEIFDVSNNKIIGNIPNVERAINLKEFNLSSNGFQGSLPTLSKNTKLQKVLIHNNKLNGFLSPLVSNTELTIFEAFNNQLTGLVPSITTLTKLENFDVGNNKLSGPLPDLNNNKALKTFRASINVLSGPLPNISANPALISLLLNDNNLYGCMNESLCTRGKTVNLKNNPLLPFKGDVEVYCRASSQIGAPCDDGNPATTRESIQEDCTCREILKVCFIKLKEDIVKVPFGIQRNIDVTINDTIPESVKITYFLPEITDLKVIEVNRTTLGFVRTGTWRDTIVIRYQVCSDTCKNCSQSVIKVVPDLDTRIVPVTIITPNGDGINDGLRFNDESIILNSELRIFNRWGGQIYHKKEYENDWDASGQPGGSYYYVLKVGDVVWKKNLVVIK